MKSYPIVAIIWEDHIVFHRETIPDDIQEVVRPTLTVGVLIKKTKKFALVAYNIERYGDLDEADFIVILCSTILGINEYGTIEIDELRTKGAK